MIDLLRLDIYNVSSIARNCQVYYTAKGTIAQSNFLHLSYVVLLTLTEREFKQITDIMSNLFMFNQAQRPMGVEFLHE